ncbi:phosphate ABC transporter substrate-binding protein PstS [Corynebacterium pyruviciproducens]|uniref:Phosphate-binding protein n=3 Tax=Corynebacterium pyruviciproducens TaxID=598660 RepID=A0AAF1BSS4_9CORY|nr:phosphate ABC transporter substrate-binding protein PstS [Corynebacterium pyruviciproducens]MDH4658404.1 phosphate ABC transporter substrate-binding protein PstS [Corynebacterium pyruviciproducens]WOT02494.1 phosphate ABC transporter substrate-binding protein PstS [Corynebacterium pyruviciproducens]
MKSTLRRSLAVLGVAAVGAFGLVGCSDSASDTASDASSAVTSAAQGAKESIQGLSGQSGTLNGEGASSQQNAMEYFKVKYGEAVDGASLNYTASGSGSGQKQFIAGQVDFGGSDSPLKEDQIEPAKERCGGNDAWHLPLVIGPVAVAYHLEGVDSVVLTPEVIAKIFNGKITKWNDEAIAALNSGASLPDKDIKVIFRSEESGTSDNFQKFLKATAPAEWDTTGKAFPSKVGSGANSSTGVVGEVKKTDGAITYVESGFAKNEGLSIAQIDFGNGPVELNKDSVNKALANIDFAGEGHDLVVDAESLFQINDAGAYPLVLTTYEIVCSAGYDAETSARVKDFLTVALNNQDSNLEQIGYVPVDGDYKAALKEAVNAIQ